MTYMTFETVRKQCESRCTGAIAGNGHLAATGRLDMAPEPLYADARR